MQRFALAQALRCSLHGLRAPQVRGLCEIRASKRTCAYGEDVEKRNAVSGIRDDVCTLAPLNYIAEYTWATRMAAVGLLFETVEKMRRHRASRGESGASHRPPLGLHGDGGQGGRLPT